MQSILIGIAVLVVCICALLYYKLKKVNQEVLRLTKKLESITADKAEVNLSNNPPPPVSVNNIKTEYDNYVQSNNFENVFEEEPISEEIKKEIDQLTDSALNNEDLTQSQVYEDAQEEPVMEPNVHLLEEEHLMDTTEQHQVHEEQLGEEDLQVNEEQLGEEELQVNEEQPVHEENIDLDLDEIEHEHVSPTNDDTFQVSNEDEDEGGEGEEGEDEGDETNQIEVNLYNNLPSTEQLLDNAINENNYTLEDINQMSVKQLQSLARKNKLKIKGRKTELIERLATLYNLNNNMK